MKFIACIFVVGGGERGSRTEAGFTDESRDPAEIVISCRHGERTGPGAADWNRDGGREPGRRTVRRWRSSRGADLTGKGDVRNSEPTMRNPLSKERGEWG